MPVSRREVATHVAVAAVTLGVMLGIAEAGARLAWPEVSHNPCYEHQNGHRNRPKAGCVARLKNAEGPWTTVAYNECGYRTVTSCGPRPRGTRRLVVMGASVAEGLYVEQDSLVSTILARRMTKQCGFPVEVQNMGSLGRTFGGQASLIPEALRLEPDAVILIFAPFDLLSLDDAPVVQGVGGRSTVGAETRAASGIGTRARALVASVRRQAKESRALVMAQHFLLDDERYLLSAYRLGAAEDALQVPVPASYQRRYDLLATELGRFAEAFSKASAPVVAVPLPSRIQAALLGGQSVLPGIDPLAFVRQVKTSAARGRVAIADPFAVFAAVPHSYRLFYAVDGHPQAGANGLVAPVVEATLAEVLPWYSACRAANQPNGAR